MGFPDQLKKARLNMDYTQQQVADLMGITKSTYCGYETGKRQPDVAKIKQLACILNTSGDVLLETGFEQEPPFENVTTEQNSPGKSLSEIHQIEDNSETSKSAKILAELYDVAKELSEDEQLYLLDTVKALKQRLGKNKT